MNRNISFALRLNDDATKALEELSKQLIAVSAAMLIFLVALGNFTKDHLDSLLIHPKYSWIAFLVSIFCGICFQLLYAKRCTVDGNRIVNNNMTDTAFQELYEHLPLSSSPWKLEKSMRTLQTASFLIGLVVAGLGLLLS